MKKSTSSKSRLIIGAAILFAILSISNSCKKTMSDPYGTGGGTGGSGGPGTNEVWIQGMAFNPATITVAAGTTIKWTNKDLVAHTVTSSSTFPFDSGSIGSNGTWSFTFTTAGNFQYKCTFHPSMIATVVVN